MLKKKVSNRNIEKIIQTDMLIPEFIQRYSFQIMIKSRMDRKEKKGEAKSTRQKREEEAQVAELSFCNSG